MDAKKYLREEREKIRNKKLEKCQKKLCQERKDSRKKIIILSSDCTGGRLMFDYNLPTYTPTINNWYSAKDFIRICREPDKYFSMKMERGEQDSNGQPTGIIGDIMVHLGHSAGYEEAKKRWEIGCKNYFRAKESEKYEICVIMNDRNYFTDDILQEFEDLPYKYKILFVHKKENIAPHTFYMHGEDNLEFVNIMTSFEGIIKRRYDRFDFYHWFLKMYQDV